MATDYAIANLALSRIGHESNLTAFSSSGNKASRWFYANYEIVKTAMLREFPWRFSTKRAVLTAETTYTISGATAANPVVITATAHGFSNGDTVYIDGVIGMTQLNGKTFTVANKTADTFELSGIDGSAYTAYSSAGTAYGYVASEYAYRYSLPSDCLRVLRVNDGETTDYRVEQGKIVTGDSTCSIEYIFDETTESNFDSQFTDLLAERLAAEICFYITANSQLTEQRWAIYRDKVRLAWTMDSRQGLPRGLDADAWTNSRL